MLNAVHKQLLAAKLADMFTSSPLVMVYQIIGNVRSTEVAANMQRQLDRTLPGHGVRATCLKMKNTVAGSSKEVSLASYLRANNILVGWQVPEASVMAHMTANANTSLQDLISWRQPSAPAASPPSTLSPPSTPSPAASAAAAAAAAASAAPSPAAPAAPGLQAAQAPLHGQQGGRARLSHRVLVPAIQQSLKLQDQLPVALLTGFYQGRQVKLRHLLEWSKLDEHTVMSGLVDELDLVGSGLLDAFAVTDSLLDVMDQAEPKELLYMLDNREEGTKAAAAVSQS